MAEHQVRPNFVLCVANDGCDDLSAGRLYRIIPDEAAAGEDHLGVIDDSGEDYLYPASRFLTVEVQPAEEQIMRETRLTLPELALIAGTRAALGAGLGLLLADRLPRGQRKAIGWTLLAIGAATTIPLAVEVLGKSRPDSAAEWPVRDASSSWATPGID